MYVFVCVRVRVCECVDTHTHTPGRTYGGFTGPVSSNIAGRQQGNTEQQPLRRSSRGCLGMWRMSKNADSSDLGPLSKHVLRPGNVRYFAFGSNLNPTVMEGMRGMRPIASEAAYVEDYRLAFNLKGLPGVEPSFASIEPQVGLRVHGLVYTLCRSDWRRLTASEGVGAAYDLEPVPILCLNVCMFLTNPPIPYIPS